MKVLYLIVCAAPPAISTCDVIPSLQAAGWDVYVIATPQAIRWIDIAQLEQLTGHVVRSDYKLPGEADPLPKADAILGMPLTFDTINKWALGIGDTLVTSLLCECLGRGSPPIVAVPCLKMDLVNHPVFHKNIAFLCECRITVLYEPERYKSPLIVPLHEVINVLQRVTEQCQEGAIMDFEQSYRLTRQV
jgi:phosphopantothenoylcysteine decarboxylase